MLISPEYPNSSVYLSTVFLIEKLTFQVNLCNGSHGIMAVMAWLDINRIAVLNICGVDYHCFIAGITKREAINLL